MDIAFGKVAVLMGGTSAEREISLKTGQAVFEALKRKHVDVTVMDVADQTFLASLQQTAFDRVFIALHGRGGEDGSIQGLLECLHLPYTGSGVLGSALAMDKYRTKQLWQANGLPTPKAVLLREREDLKRIPDELGFPVMIKPALEGSSVGMTKVTHPEQLQPAWEIAAQYRCEVMAEQYITGAEYTVSILDNQALPAIRLETPREFYDFDAKYYDAQTQYHCPCGLSPEQEQKLRALAVHAFLAVNASSWGRVDFMWDEAGQPWLLEVNTIPGMTDHSLVPMAAKAAGIEFDELVLRILATTR